MAEKEADRLRRELAEAKESAALAHRNASSWREEMEKVRAERDVALTAPPKRRRLPEERDSKVHKFTVGGHEGYLITGFYEDWTIGEIFIRMAKEGSTISGMFDSFAIAVSLGLQRGVPIDELAAKFVDTNFDPSGPTLNAEIPRASSVPDYVFKVLQKYEEARKAKLQP